MFIMKKQKELPNGCERDVQLSKREVRKQVSEGDPAHLNPSEHLACKHGNIRFPHLGIDHWEGNPEVGNPDTIRIIHPDSKSNAFAKILSTL